MYVTLLLLPLSILLLLVAVVQDFIPNKSLSKSSLIEPVIPGVNLPASELGYYSLSMIISSFVHELGHALAAVKEDVHIVNIGFNIYFILPIAYVNLSSEKLLSLNPWKQLKILCAGIWHNIVTALLVYLLYLLLPHMFLFLFNVNTGVYVTNINKHSPLLGTKGLFAGNIVHSINDCPVKTEEDWYSCINKMKFYKPGYCTTAETVHNLDESDFLKHLPNGLYDCCSSDKSDYLCFEYLDNGNGILEIPPHACLPARTIIEKSPQYCTLSKHCPNSYHCIRPYMDNSTLLLTIGRSNAEKVVYIGHPSDLSYTVQVSSFVPKAFFTTSSFPDVVLKLLSYLCIFNIGLALVNVLPCIFMDGQYITNTVIYLLLRNKLDNSHTVTTISLVASLLGMTLLLCHCIYVIMLKLVF